MTGRRAPRAGSGQRMGLEKRTERHRRTEAVVGSASSCSGAEGASWIGVLGSPFPGRACGAGRSELDLGLGRVSGWEARGRGFEGSVYLNVPGRLGGAPWSHLDVALVEPS